MGKGCIILSASENVLFSIFEVNLAWRMFLPWVAIHFPFKSRRYKKQKLERIHWTVKNR